MVEDRCPHWPTEWSQFMESGRILGAERAFVKDVLGAAFNEETLHPNFW
jgi:hypothetical protein